MTHISICGVDRLKATVAAAKPDLVISITDPGATDVAFAKAALTDYAGPVLSLAFHDVIHDSDHNTTFSADMARDVLSAVDAHIANGSGTLVVHCAMGISRSTAVAACALAHIRAKASPATPDLARSVVDAVYAAAPGANPNTRVIATFAPLLGDFGGAVSSAVQDGRNAMFSRLMHRDAD